MLRKKQPFCKELAKGRGNVFQAEGAESEKGLELGKVLGGKTRTYGSCLT